MIPFGEELHHEGLLALLPSHKYNVITLECLGIQIRDVFGRILKIAVHGDYPVSLCLVDTCRNRDTLPVIFGKMDRLDMSVRQSNLLNLFPRMHPVTVIYHDDLIFHIHAR